MAAVRVVAGDKHDADLNYDLKSHNQSTQLIPACLFNWGSWEEIIWWSLSPLLS